MTCPYRGERVVDASVLLDGAGAADYRVDLSAWWGMAPVALMVDHVQVAQVTVAQGQRLYTGYPARRCWVPIDGYPATDVPLHIQIANGALATIMSITIIMEN